MANIRWDQTEDDKLFQEMFETFIELGKDGLYLDQYELAEVIPAYNVEQWKAFLTEPKINQYIQNELAIVRNQAANKVLKDIDKSKSVGQAQILNALSKYNQDNQTKDGPIFVYTYIPLSSEQEHATNVHKLNTDIFSTEQQSQNTFKQIAYNIVKAITLIGEPDEHEINTVTTELEKYFGGTNEN